MIQALTVGAVVVVTIALAGMAAAFVAGKYRERARNLARGHELRRLSTARDTDDDATLAQTHDTIDAEADAALADESAAATEAFLEDYSK